MLTLPPRSPDEPKSHWLYRSLRDGILDGRLRPGDRLPSSRELAKSYGVSRGIVVEVYEQLCAEAFTEGRFGGGTVVTPSLAAPPAALRRRGPGIAASPTPQRLSARGAALDALVQRDAKRLPDGFAWIRTPAPDLFPMKRWQQLVARTVETDPALLGPSQAQTHPAFQQAVAKYLRLMRSVTCEPEQIFAIESMGSGLRDLLYMLLEPGEAMWMEDPGQPAILPLALANGVDVVPVPVDAAGFDVRAALRLRRDAKFVVVTPEHQDVFGTTMTLERRMALLDWAERSDGWIFEADYESEYRYAGRPTTSLQGLGDGRRVFYTGSFARLLFQTVRTAYVVVPPQLVDAFSRVRLSVAGGPQPATQASIAAFFESGELDRHVRRMREAYRGRLRSFRTAVERHAADLVTLAEADSGMSVVGWLRPGVADAPAAAAAQQAGLKARSITEFTYMRPPLAPGLIFGFASLPPGEADGATAQFAALLRARLG
jgi:GntR family transcriptional regulator / MocR family aminotransferase